MSTTVMITCPHCHRKNRLPDERLTGEGNCGACKKALFSGKPVVVDMDNFNRHLSGDLPVVVDFWAPWCGPCRQFAPAFESAAKVLEPRARLLKVNTEEQQGLAQRYGIRSIPTLMMFSQGKEKARMAGALPAQQFIKWVEQNL
jgi:thioredoxin 2